MCIDERMNDRQLGILRMMFRKRQRPKGEREVGADEALIISHFLSSISIWEESLGVASTP
jgi:hypothetical protein